MDETLQAIEIILGIKSLANRFVIEFLDLGARLKFSSFLIIAVEILKLN